MGNRRPWFVTMWLVLLLVSGGAAQAEWQAGVARVEITPQGPLWMSGYAGRTKPAEGTLSPLFAKALALRDDGGQTLLVITLDLLGLDRDVSQGILTTLEKATKLPRASIALCTSHTHSGPVVGRNLSPAYSLSAEELVKIAQYTSRLEEQVAAVGAEAVQRLAPALATWGQGTATFAVNRRANKEAEIDQLRNEGKLQGPSDHSVPLLAVRDKAGKLKAVLFGYACHATTLAGQQYSADWPGFAQAAIEERHPGATALFFAGCGGDQNPLPRRKVELAQGYGRQIADAVDATLSESLRPIEGRSATRYQEIALPYEKLPSRAELEQARDGADRYQANRARLLLAQLDTGRPLAPSYPYPVQTWRLGDGPRWTLLGGEVVVDYALRVKREHGRDTWIGAYANDVMAYIPSRRVWLEGGYEGAGAMVYYGLPSRWAENAEELIHAEIARQMQAISE